MSWKELIEILAVFVLSALKFGLVGVPTAVFAKWSIFKVLTVTISGGLFGTVLFTFLSEALILSYKTIKKKIAGADQKIKKKFTFTNKLIVKAKHRFGLLGIAILGPSVLSIPLGVFLAVRYFKDKKKIMTYFFVSIIFWAITLYFFYHNLYHLFF